MNVLLVYTNRDRFFYPPPIGLAYISEGLKQKGHKIKLVDFMFSKNPIKELENAIAEFNPEVIGFSIRNIDNQVMLNSDCPLYDIKSFIKLAKDKKIITVAGGTGLSAFPEKIVEFMDADYGICGQGEESFRMLLDKITEGNPVKDIPGIIWRENGIIKSNPLVFEGYQNVKADWGILDFKMYKRKSLFPASVVIKTGCPYSCSYCEVPGYGNNFKFREPDEIINDIKIIRDTHGIKSFWFVDSCFNSPLHKTKQLLKEIIKADLKINYMVPVNPIKGEYDEEFFELYKRSGGLLTLLGADSLCDSMLKNYSKNYTVEDIYNCGNLANKYKIPFFLGVLIGGPGENEETVKESMRFAPNIKFAHLHYGIGIRILPNTGIYETAIRENIITGPDELFFPKFYVSKELDVKWAKSYIDKSMRKYFYRDFKLLWPVTKNIITRFV